MSLSGSVPIPIFKSFFIEKDAQCTFSRKLPDDKILFLYLKIEQEKDSPSSTNWIIKVYKKLEDVNPEVIKLRNGVHKLVGSWNKIMERPDVSLNLNKESDEFSKQALGELFNETLLEISGSANGVSLKSNYLEGTVDFQSPDAR